MGEGKLRQLLEERDSSENLTTLLSSYKDRFSDDEDVQFLKRVENSAELSKEYYRLSTNFYLNAWGRMFHFANQEKQESLKSAQLRHEKILGDKLKLEKGEKCLDLGSGVAGPMINMVKNYGVQCTGINNSDYQIEKANQFVREEGVSDNCDFIECDWQSIPLQNASFDKAFTIEAVCHAANYRHKVFSEVYRLLKPGSYFGGYDWVMTDRFDPKNEDHQRIKGEIEIGSGVSLLTGKSELKAALESAGFEVLEYLDASSLEAPGKRPWYYPLEGRGLNLMQIRRHPVTRYLVRALIKLLIFFNVLPKSTIEVGRILNRAGVALVEGGKLRIFTPMQFFLAKKPVGG